MDLVQSCKNDGKYRFEKLIPNYESTRGSTESERSVALQNFCKDLQLQNNMATRISLRCSDDVPINNQSKNVSIKENQTVKDLTNYGGILDDAEVSDFKFESEEIIPPSPIYNNYEETDILPQKENSHCTNNNNNPDYLHDSTYKESLPSIKSESQSMSPVQGRRSSNECLAPPVHNDMKKNEVSTRQQFCSDNLNSPQINNNTNENRVRERDFCLYCKTLVSQFARHIARNHRFETEVQKILSKPLKSRERMGLIAALRKKGNYFNSNHGKVKPVRKAVTGSSPSKVLPCLYCLGFYAKRQLWRHQKRCFKKPDNSSKKFSQAEAQNLFINNMPIDSNLKEQVFPRMRADLISLVAKQDILICSFGSHFLETHSHKHTINLTSRKMRELAKLLLELRTRDPNIKKLLPALKPKYFDLIVEAVKSVARYDITERKFKAPSYVASVGNSLKECCEIAISRLQRKGYDLDGKTRSEVEVKAEADLCTMISLLNSKWYDELPHQAANDLHVRKVRAVNMKKDFLTSRELNRTSNCSLGDEGKVGQVHAQEEMDESIKALRSNATPGTSSSFVKQQQIYVRKEKKRRQQVPWTTEQKKLVYNFFKDHILNKKPPRRHECEILLKKNRKVLHNRNWLKIKVFVQNCYTKKLSSKTFQS